MYIIYGRVYDKWTRFNDSTLIINADLIQTVEETPDTVITLTTGTKFIVKEKSKEIVDKVENIKEEFLLILLLIIENKHIDKFLRTDGVT